MKRWGEREYWEDDGTSSARMLGTLILVTIVAVGVLGAVFLQMART